MDNTFCKDLYEAVNATTEEQKFGASALAMAIIAEPMNKTGFSWGKMEDVERVVYGRSDLYTRVATLTGITAGNDLLIAVKKAFPEEKISYGPIFSFLEGRKIIDGVCYKEENLE